MIQGKLVSFVNISVDEDVLVWVFADKNIQVTHQITVTIQTDPVIQVVSDQNIHDRLVLLSVSDHGLDTKLEDQIRLETHLY